MSKKNDILNDIDLEKEAPLLSGIPKRNPFTVPEGYFDSLPSGIMEKCREVTAPVLSNKIFWLFRPQWMMAVFVCVICLTFTFRHNTTPTYEELTANVSDSAIFQSLQNNIDYVDESTLEDALQNVNITAVPARTDSAASNQQAIVNYLMNHNIDASDIEDEL
jgi:hypothetical protein